MLPKKARLSSEREIRQTIKTKQYESRSHLLYLVAQENTLDVSRLAVVTPKKLGKAVVRNRLRRIFQAAFVKIRHKIAKNINLVIFPRPSAIGKTAGDAEVGLVKCLNRIKLA